MADYAVVGWFADSRGRTRALFIASAGNTQSPLHVPGSLGLSNIIPLTFIDATDVIRGNTGCRPEPTLSHVQVKQIRAGCVHIFGLPSAPMQHACLLNTSDTSSC